MLMLMLELDDSNVQNYQIFVTNIFDSAQRGIYKITDNTHAANDALVI